MLKEEEIDLLLNDVYEIHGYDFSNYAEASLKRRVNRLYQLDKFPSFAEFRYRLKSDSFYINRFIEEVTVNVTEMFRDPGFYRYLRLNIIPMLAPRPFIRIWHAGCSTGEEVLSMAIILKEKNLLEKSLLYATDLSADVLDKARNGVYPLQQMQIYSQNYIQSGGTNDFSSYYTARYDHAKFDEDLRRKIIFSTHNLVSDRSFNSFDLIICRNVLIYFDQQLQERVLQLFDESLEKLGYLALGSKENIRFTGISPKYRQEGREKIWRKIR